MESKMAEFLKPDEMIERGHQRVVGELSRSMDVNFICRTYGDDPLQMTYSRLIARYLSKFRWYNPRAGKEDDCLDAETGARRRPPRPSLDDAWAYYEHVTLARYYVDDEREGTMVRAEPGEFKRKTELYPFWRTPVRELMDFGISVRMYFSTLLVLASFLFAAGFFNIPLQLFFASEDYSSLGKDKIDRVIRGSAICDDTEWVACQTCNDEYKDRFPAYRLDGTYVLKNNCDVSNAFLPGLFSYIASVALVIMFGVAFFVIQRKAEVVFDEEVQTPPDYSVKISNPPGDAYDPEEWKQFFSSFANTNVTLCTVALDNAELIRQLIQRRKLIKQLQKELPPGSDIDDIEWDSEFDGLGWKKALHFIPCFPSAQKTHSRVKEQENKIRDLMARDYKVSAVFVTFETERGQRNVLTALSTGKLNIWRNKPDVSKLRGNEILVEESAQPSSLKCSYLTTAYVQEEEMNTYTRSFRLPSSSNATPDSFLRFRSEHVLQVKEPGEPNDVRWSDLQVPVSVRFVQRICTTLGLIGFITLSGWFINHLQQVRPGTYYTPLYIAITNVVVPKICEILVDFESHATDGGRQASLYVKVAIFRWFNSAIVTSIITGFISTVSYEDGQAEESLCSKVYPIIFAEMVVTPLIQLLDITGIIRKHILAPRARDQEEMNLLFCGTKFELAERYTDVTKIVFMAFFYSAILPEAFFLGSITLIIHFLVGKFCLLRTWRPAPAVGNQLARFSLNYFFSLALVAHIIMSAYWWSGYPYDNVCANNGKAEYCNQDMFRSGLFPPLPRFQEGQWMSESQEKLTSLYGWSSLLLVIFATFVLTKETVVPAITSIFMSTYKPDGKDQGIDFSKVKSLHEVSGYVPQYKEPGFIHPLIACDTEGINEDLVGWKDHYRGFKPHSLFHDARSIAGKDLLGAKPVFSVVKHWPPEPTSEKA